MIRFMTLLVLAFAGLTGQCSSQRITLSPSEFYEAIQELKELQQPYMLLDVRTTSEYKSGHLEKATLLNWQADDFKEQFKSLNIPQNTPIFLYCYMGGRSAEAAEWIRQQGYIQVADLKGGIYQWQKEKLPVVKK